ncbi:MAG: hypothetical protein WCG23_05915 [bacterium]
MKTREKISQKADNLKSFGNIVGKAGYGMKLAANLGYKVGYNIAKHPTLEKVKKQIDHNPRASLITLAGVTLGVIGAAGYFALKEKY